MRLSAIGAILALAWLGSSVPAQASSDGGCPLQWKLEHRDRSACSNLAILQPGNDTRTNLMLLLQDQNPSSTKSTLGKTLIGWQELSAALYPEPARKDDAVFGYHSRCQTNGTGRDGFLKAVRLRGNSRVTKVKLSLVCDRQSSLIVRAIRMDWMSLPIWRA